MCSRYWFSLLLIAASVLIAACMDTPLPMPTPTSTASPLTPTQLPPTPTPTAMTTPRPPTAQPIIGPLTPRATVPPTATHLVPIASPNVPTVTPGKPTPLNLGIAVGNIYYPQAAAFDRQRGLLYILGRQSNNTTDHAALSVVSLNQAQVIATIPLTITAEYGTSMAISADGTQLFLLDSPDRIDAQLMVVSTGVGIEKPGIVLRALANVRAIALADNGENLYVLRSGVLERLNVQTMTVEAAYSSKDLPTPPPPVLLAVNTQVHRLFLVRPTGVVSIFDAVKLRHLADMQLEGVAKAIVAHPKRSETYILVESLRSGVVAEHVAVVRDDHIAATWPNDGPFAIGRLAIDEGSGQVLLLEDSRGTVTQSSRVRVVDPSSGQVTHSLGLPYINLTYAREVLVYQNMLYHVLDIVLPVKLDTGKIAEPIFIGINLIGSALDEQNKRLFVMDSAGAIHVVDTSVFIQTAVWPHILKPNLTAILSTHMAVVAGKLYVADYQANQTLVLDAMTGTQIATIARAGQVTVDARRNRIFITNQGVYIANGATYNIEGAITGTVREHPQLVTPGAIAAQYEPAYDLLFVTMSNNSPGSSNSSWLQIYDGEKLTRLSSNIRSDQQFVAGLAIEPAVNRVWLASTFPNRHLMVFDRGGQIQVRFKGLGGRLFLDSSRERLYVLDWYGIIKIATRDTSIVGYLPFPLIQPNIMAYDAMYHRFYINYTASATLATLDPEESPVIARTTLPALPPGRVMDIQTDANNQVIVSLVMTETGQIGIFHSSPGGWLAIHEGLPVQMNPRIVVAYDMPGVIFAYSESTFSGSGFFRTTDGGYTWQPVSAGLTDFRIAALALSPTFRRDGSGFLLTADQSLYSTNDHGRSWFPVPNAKGSFVAVTSQVDGPPLVMVLGSHPTVITKTVMFIGTAAKLTQTTLDLPVSFYALLGLTLSPSTTPQAIALAAIRGDPSMGWQEGFLISQDLGQTWKHVPVGTGISFPRVIVRFSPMFAHNTEVYALFAPSFSRPQDRSVVLRSRDGGWCWEWSSNADPLTSAIAVSPSGLLWTGTIRGIMTQIDPALLTWQAVVLPTPTPTPPRPPTPVPTPTSLPSGLYYPDPIFATLWARPEIWTILGWAKEPHARDVWIAYQPFEKGHMIWREDARTIIVLTTDGAWSAHEDMWSEGQPELDPAIVAPAGRVQPKRGFGKLWRSNEAIRQALGWGMTEERGYTARVQDFERGAIIQFDVATYVIGYSNHNARWLQP